MSLLPRFACLLLTVVLLRSAAAEKTIVANDFGAKGDGVTVDTGAIQRALDAAAGTHSIVTLRAGTYLIGSIFVKSDTHFVVPRGVTLRGLTQLDAYPEMPTRVAGIEMTWPAALVNVYKQKDVQITGEGTIDGDGSVWWKRYWDLRHEYDAKGLRWAADYDARRPRLIQIFDSSAVTLDGPMLMRSGFWTVHICYSRDVTVDHITIRNNLGGRGPSTDGVDIDSSHDVLVQHADIDVNDDALCLKAGRDADGLRVNRPTENVVLRDSIIRSGAAAVTFGSETSGGFRHIEAYNLTAGQGVGAGVLIKSARVRGGGGRDLRIHDLHLHGVRIPIEVNLNWNPNYSYAVIPPEAHNVPPYWRVLAKKVARSEGLPHFEDVHIADIDATGAQTAIVIAAYPDALLKDFTIEHVQIAAASAGSIRDTDGLVLKGVRLEVPSSSRLEASDDINLRGLNGVRYETPDTSPVNP
jgi:polygalacturonase